MGYILAHDLGTTGNKATLYDEEGQLIGSEFVGYSTKYPHVNWAEQDPMDWWQAVCQSTNLLVSNNKVDKSMIKVVSFSGQMMGCVPLDKNGNPLRSSIIWADQRSVAQADQIRDALGEETAYKITGHRISPAYSVEKMMWVRDNQPDIYGATFKFVQAKDFIIHRLVGRFVTDYTDACGCNLFDINKYQWAEEILQCAQVDERKLPEVCSSFAVAGEVNSKVADEVGLNPGTPVVIGASDGACATAGAGVVREGCAYLYIGSSAWIGLLSDVPVYDKTRRTSTWLAMDHKKYMPAGTMQSAGGSYTWLRDTLCSLGNATEMELGDDPYKLMDMKAQNSSPVANGLIYLPYLMGERSPHWNSNARAAFIGLTQKHQQADVIRAVLEGVAFNLRIIMDCLERDMNISELRIIGGGAKGEIWRQIIADIFGKKVLLPQFIGEATSLGAAIAGGIGVGIYKDLDQIENLNPIQYVQEPDQERMRVYARAYPTFNRAYQSLVEVFDDLASL